MNTQLKTWIKGWLSHLTFWRTVAITIFVLGLYATVVRFAQGLGAATNLSDEFPWGLWIGFDVLVGVGLAAGGFVLAATVHVFHLERYKPIARPTILTAFLGYMLVVVALMFDLGLPYRIWHPLVMWNPHSVMFEVAWCVMLYTAVLALEFSPLVFERFGWVKPLRIVRAVFVPLVIVGVLLSTLHQSSLGTLYVIASDKLHGLWYTPLLPVFFFISAIAGGLAMTIFESFMSRRAFGRRLETELLDGLARAAVVVLALYTLLKVEDLMGRGVLGLVFTVTPESTMFWGEMALGAILPMILFAIPQVRRNETGMFLAAVLTVVGFIVNRLNVAITGMAASSGVLYIPSWMEFTVTIAIFTAGFVLFGLAVEHLAIYPVEELPEPITTRDRTVPLYLGGTLPKGVLIPLWALFAVGALLVASSIRNADAEARIRQQSEVATAPTAQPDEAAPELKLPAPFAFAPAEESPGVVTFDHRSHVDAGAPECAACHRNLFSLLEPGKPLEGDLSYERVHEGDLCYSCHNGDEASAVDDACESCHK
ncbi:MAG: Ni/Fe-hydrogenase cytochrome b subunit [Deltaproteobacteria bacterium]|nr:Ni/Fe-hydrogenase cytochrome b subunit [Deltaproteobacteria bacterium]